MRLKKDLYQFCEVPEQIANEIRTSDDFKDGYVIKHIWITDNIKRTMYVRIKIYFFFLKNKLSKIIHTFMDKNNKLINKKSGSLHNALKN